MELQGSITINGKKYEKGDIIAWYKIYPFFLLHMGMFGGSGFFMAYAADSVPLVFLYLHGGFACLVYVLFYVTIFGVDRIRWMFINAVLGLFGIYAQIDWILSKFGKQASDFSAFVHFIPFFYYVLYTFLLHQMVLDLFQARSNERRRRWIDLLYITASVLIYGWLWLDRN